MPTLTAPPEPTEARPPAQRATYEEYAAWPEDAGRYELIDGYVYAMTAAPRFFHQAIAGEIFVALHNWNREANAGTVGIAPIDVILDADGARETVVQPDVLFVADTGPGRVTERGVDGPPTLVAEVLSPGTRAYDVALKRHTYDRYGVAELWLVDGEAREVTVLRQRGGAFAHAATLGEGATLNSPLLPGFEAEVEALFRR
jgi:Uma2 family endonuclease